MPPAESALKVLIAEDNSAIRMVMNALVCELGYRTVLAADGIAAVDVFAAEQPDIVLLDLYMPRMDGPDAMVRMRALAGERWVPIIFVTADDHIESQVSLLAQGADDYLIKPVHKDLLCAKLVVAARMVRMRRQIEDNNRRLQDYHDSSETELEVVKRMLARMAHEDQVSDPMLEQWLLPATNLSGDMVAAARTPRGVLHVMLADGTGHGLAAALNVLPIAPVFYTMTEKGLDIELIATALNRTIKDQLPTGRFVAATLIAVDYGARRVRIWNGGNPAVVALDDDGAVIARFPARNLALGILPAVAYAPEFDVFDYAGPCQLLACSDGVYESLDAVDGAGGEAATTALLQGVSPRMRMKVLRNRLIARDAEQPAHDDMTALFVRCGGEASASLSPAVQAGKPEGPTGVTRKFDIVLAPAEMQDLDVVPMLLDLIATIPAARPHRHGLGVVLSELYTNALDHGVLGLESDLKDQDDRLEHFAATRAAALRNLQSGSIRIQIDLRIEHCGPLLDIKVRDSGPGFGFAALGGMPAMASDKPFGRGIALLRTLCTSVEYHGIGNEVSVCYALEAPVTELSRAA